MEYITRGGGRLTLTHHTDAELRKVLSAFLHGEAIHPELSELLVHLGYLSQGSDGLALTTKGHHVMKR